MGSHTEGLDRLQGLLRSGNAVAGVPAKPRPMQLYIWQIPVNLLNVSIILFLIGLAIHLFAMALTRDSRTWTDEKKVGQSNLTLDVIFRWSNSRLLWLLGLQGYMPWPITSCQLSACISRRRRHSLVRYLGLIPSRWSKFLKINSGREVTLRFYQRLHHLYFMYLVTRRGFFIYFFMFYICMQPIRLWQVINQLSTRFFA